MTKSYYQMEIRSTAKGGELIDPNISQFKQQLEADDAVYRVIRGVYRCKSHDFSVYKQILWEGKLRVETHRFILGENQADLPIIVHGDFYEMRIHDKTHGYELADSNNVEIMSKINTNPNIEKIGVGIYRSRGNFDYFKDSYEDDRWGIEILRNKQITRTPSITNGSYYEMSIYDKLNRWKPSDPYDERILYEINKDSAIEKVGIGKYRSRQDFKLFKLFEDQHWAIKIKHYDLGAAIDSKQSDRGYYEELHIYDRKDFYRVKDPDIKNFEKKLKSFPGIYKVEPGVYRGLGLRSFASINQTSRWRMEVSEKFDGHLIKRAEKEKYQCEWFTPIKERTCLTYFKDVGLFLVRSHTSWLFYLCMFGLGLSVLYDVITPEPTLSLEVDYSRDVFGLLFFIIAAPAAIFTPLTLCMYLSAPIQIIWSYKKKQDIVLFFDYIEEYSDAHKERIYDRNR